MLAEVGLLLLVGWAHVLRLVRGSGGGGRRDVGDGVALAAEEADEEEDGYGAPKDCGDEGRGEGRHK